MHMNVHVNMHARNLVMQGIWKSPTYYFIFTCPPTSNCTQRLGVKISLVQLLSVGEGMEIQNLFYIADGPVISKTILKRFALASLKVFSKKKLSHNCPRRHAQEYSPQQTPGERRVQERGWVSNFSTGWTISQQLKAALAHCYSGGIRNVTIYVAESSRIKGPAVPSPSGTGEEGRPSCGGWGQQLEQDPDPLQAGDGY